MHYTKSTVEVIEFTAEEVVMNLAASAEPYDPYADATPTN